MHLPSNYQYFDYAAGWPVREEALEAYVAAVRLYGNPGSVHQAGQRTHALLEKSRERVARALKTEAKSIVFNATATEANNLAISGTIEAYWRAHPGVTPRVIISAIEHDAVRVPCEVFAADGFIDLVTIPVTAEGGFDMQAFEKALNEQTALVSVMQVNNETGVLLPTRAIAERVRAHRGNGVWPRLHVDAAQALAYVPELATEYADLVTYSGYKVGAVPGSAVLVVQDRDTLKSLIRGGGQERGLRSGTEDVAAAASLATAIELVRDELPQEAQRIAELKALLVSEIQKANLNIEVNGDHLECAPHIINLWIPGVRAQQTVTRLDLAGFAIAAGPACSAFSLEPSKTLLAMGYSKERASESVRVSLGEGTRNNASENENKFNKLGRARIFATDGEEYIKSARVLFEQKQKITMSSGLLLIHGIELLLKSYLLIKNPDVSDEHNAIDRYLRNLGHDYLKLYKKCQKYGNELKQALVPGMNASMLEVQLTSMSQAFYPDSVTIRYPAEAELSLFDSQIFSVIDRELIEPIKNLNLSISQTNESNESHEDDKISDLSYILRNLVLRNPALIRREGEPER